MPYVDLGEFTMFYTDEGDGPPVLCVHGWTCDGSDWSWQVPAFVPGHRVIAVDPRGHGRSTAPADGYGPLFFADDLAALLARLGTGPVVAMGHSMGGATVVALAVEYPELVRAVVSVDSAFGFDPAGLEGIAQFLDLLKAPGGNQVAREFFGRFYPAACPPHLPVLHARRVEAMDHGALWKSFEGLLVRSFGENPDAERYLPRVQCPVRDRGPAVRGTVGARAVPEPLLEVGCLGGHGPLPPPGAAGGVQRDLAGVAIKPAGVEPA